MSYIKISMYNIIAQFRFLCFLLCPVQVSHSDVSVCTVIFVETLSYTQLLLLVDLNDITDDISSHGHRGTQKPYSQWYLLLFEGLS